MIEENSSMVSSPEWDIKSAIIEVSTGGWRNEDIDRLNLEVSVDVRVEIGGEFFRVGIGSLGNGEVYTLPCYHNNLKFSFLTGLVRSMGLYNCVDNIIKFSRNDYSGSSQIRPDFANYVANYPRLNGLIGTLHIATRADQEQYERIADNYFVETPGGAGGGTGVNGIRNGSDFDGDQSLVNYGNSVDLANVEVPQITVSDPESFLRFSNSYQDLANPQTSTISVFTSNYPTAQKVPVSIEPPLPELSLTHRIEGGKLTLGVSITHKGLIFPFNLSSEESIDLLELKEAIDFL